MCFFLDTIFCINIINSTNVRVCSHNKLFHRKKTHCGFGRESTACELCNFCQLAIKFFMYPTQKFKKNFTNSLNILPFCVYSPQSSHFTCLFLCSFFRVCFILNWRSCGDFGINLWITFYSSLLVVCRCDFFLQFFF